MRRSTSSPTASSRTERPGRARTRNPIEECGVTIESVRTCLGCRQRQTTRSLLRVVARGGTVVVDLSASLPGRGAWIHPRSECVDAALTRKAFGRALRNPDATVDAEMFQQVIAPIPADSSPEEPPLVGQPLDETDGPPGPR